MQKIKTVFGRLNGITITLLPSNEEITAFPYKPIRVEADGKVGLFNLKYVDNLDSWIIYQFLEMNEDIIKDILTANEYSHDISNE